MSQEVAPHPRGLPCVLFIEDEEAFLVKTGLSEEEAALEMRGAFQQLQQLAGGLRAKRGTLERSLPATRKTLLMVRTLQARSQTGEEKEGGEKEGGRRSRGGGSKGGPPHSYHRRWVMW